MTSENTILNSEKLNDVIHKIAEQIIAEFNKEELEEVALVGIQRRGVPLAKRLCEIIKIQTGTCPKLAKLDISMYRDDIGYNKKLPIINETSIPFDVNNKIVILTDDVLFTGRTIRAALDAITDYGRPKIIRLAGVIDRGGREFPIRSDYVGLEVDIPKNNHIKVKWREIDEKDEVIKVIFN